jgi:hypothetical protein
MNERFDLVMKQICDIGNDISVCVSTVGNLEQNMYIL